MVDIMDELGIEITIDYPLSDSITYHTYKIKDKSTRNPQKRENIRESV